MWCASALSPSRDLMHCGPRRPMCLHFCRGTFGGRHERLVPLLRLHTEQAFAPSRHSTFEWAKQNLIPVCWNIWSEGRTGIGLEGDVRDRSYFHNATGRLLILWRIRSWRQVTSKRTDKVRAQYVRKAPLDRGSATGGHHEPPVVLGRCQRVEVTRD